MKYSGGELVVLTKPVPTGWVALESILIYNEAYKNNLVLKIHEGAIHGPEDIYCIMFQDGLLRSVSEERFKLVYEV